MDNQMNNGGFNTEIKNELKGRGLFYGVVAVATFIVMAVGATFAYFTATTNSANTAVTTGSTTLELQYISYETAWMSGDLIPVDTDTVAYSFENQNDTTLRTGEGINPNANILCRDDYGNSICSVYVFQVKNTAFSPQTVSLNVVSELNEFENLTAMAFEVAEDTESGDYDSEENGNGSNDPYFKLKGDEEGDPIVIRDGNGQPVDLDTFEPEPVYVNRKGVIKTMLNNSASESNFAKEISLIQVIDSSTNTNDNVKDRTVQVADGFEIKGGEIRTYALLLYILDNGRDQTASDAKKNFTGQVVIKSGDGVGGVSGRIQAVEDMKNPSGDDDDDNPEQEDPVQG